ncbi:MAG: tyrosine--tRNA ligase [bacterium]|nr:tyrosine--tRNA ligase [bacterium]MDA1293004.1 tyrosine--tRNA ligase [bacterium]
MSDLLTRGVTNVTPKDLAEKKLKAGKPIRVYLGIDPTGAHLHLGHSVPLRKLQAFADAGNEVIFLIGSFTAMIGDPTGQDKMRAALTKEDVEKNFENYKKQAEKVLDFSKIEIRYNHEWLEKLGFEDIAKLASHITVQQMLERDMFDKRMKEGNPITVTEFLYPLMVGYDSVELDVDCELGGNDQYFNMLAGRTLQKAFGKREKFVLTTKLIEGTDGRKMSKTYDNCVYLDDDAHDMFGKIMSVNDELMGTYFECCTDVPMDEVKTILASSPREAKARLAKEIVTLYHSAEGAEGAEVNFNAVFKDGGVPDDIEVIEVAEGAKVIDVLVDKGLISSKSEGRRLVEQGGIKKDDVAIDSIDAETEEGIYKVGKRKFLRITHG